MEDTTVYVGRASFRMTTGGDATDEHVVLFPPKRCVSEGAGGTEQTKTAWEGGDASLVVNAALVTDFVANADTEEIIDTVAVGNTGSVGVADRIAQILEPQRVGEVADSGADIKVRRNGRAGVVSGQYKTPLWIVASAVVIAVAVMLLGESSIRESARGTAARADRAGRPPERGFVAPAVTPLPPPPKADVGLVSSTPDANPIQARAGASTSRRPKRPSQRHESAPRGSSIAQGKRRGRHARSLA